MNDFAFTPMQHPKFPPTRRIAAISLVIALAALTAACGGGGGSPPPPPPVITVTISPLSQNVPLGGQQQFTATVTGATNTAVTWSLSGTGCSGAACGTLSGTGLYVAPAILPSPATVTIRAVSQASGTSSASATVTITSDVVVSITAPGQNANVELGAQQQITKSVTSTGNGADLNVNWTVSGTGCTGAACGTITSAGVYTAPAILPATTGNNVTVTATSMADPSKSATLTLHITATFTFTINSPPGNAIDNATSFQFLASFSIVQGSAPSQSVNWSVSGAGCIGTACGVIDQAGLYTAPNLAPSPAQVTIDAQSLADPSKHQQVTITVNSVVVVVIQPSAPLPCPPGITASLCIEIEGQQTFTANVGGTANQNVTWSLTGPGCANAGNPCGSLSVTPTQVVVSTFQVIYTAPVNIPNPAAGIGPVTITVASAQDPTKTDSVTPTFFSTIQPSIVPGGATRAVNHRQALEAVLVRTSTGTAPVSNAVEWTVIDSQNNRFLGGNATVGFICTTAADPTACSQISVSPSGPPTAPFQVDYRAPATVPTPSSVTIEMRSQADPSKFTTATVNVVANISVSVSPSTSTLPPNGTQQFSANVAGAFNQAVTWSVGPATGGACNEASLTPSGAGKISCGVIDQFGSYTAPAAAPATSSPGNQVAITATSVDTSTQSGGGTVTIAAGAFITKIFPASITALGTGSTDFTLRVQGTSFVASSPGPGSTIVFNAQNLTTTCSASTVCTATIAASSVTNPGDYGVQVSNPPGSPQPGTSNLVALKVVDPGTQVKNFDNAPAVSLTTGSPKAGCGSDTTPDPNDANCQNILVVEPTTSGSGNPSINIVFIGLVANSSCNINKIAIVIQRPASGTQDFDVCVQNNFAGPDLSVNDTFTLSGPTPADITIVNKQVFFNNNFIIQLTLRVPSTAQLGPRTVFVENKNREKAAMAGGIEIKP